MGVVTRATLVALLVVVAARANTGAGQDAGAKSTGPKTTRDRIYSKEQATRGETQFGKVCATCHDPAKVPAGKKPAPALIGDKWYENWKDRPLGEFFTIIQTTMPNDGSVVLTDDETADLVAYLLKANGLPDGPAPLKGGASSKDIVIVK